MSLPTQPPLAIQRRLRLTLVLTLAAALAGCPSEEPPPPEPPFEPGPWDIGQPELGPEVERRGLHEVRAIAHLHSHWSHDACDGDPQPGGVPDEDCLSDLREGLCTTRIDVAFLSDHPTHANEAPLAARLLNRGSDELVLNDVGTAIATWMTCDTGHRVLLIPGIEGPLMPFGIEEDLPEAWGSASADNVQSLQESGAVVWVAHTEQWDLEALAALQLDGFELYQLHANLSPSIREDYLGLEPYSYLGDVAPFFFPVENGILDPPHPDLAPIAFLELNDPSITALETLGQDRAIAITGGTDAHQNVFESLASDGERIDSYRRMTRWFNNRLKIEGELSPTSAKEALVAGRNHIVFETFGTPLGFDFRISFDDTTYEIGSEFDIARGIARVQVDLPTLDLRSPRGYDLPAVTGRLYRATEAGRELVEEWSDGPLDLAITEAGVYRVEIWISPHHLKPYLGEVAGEFSGSPVLWTQTGAIFVRSTE
jgi:hypothetical protein